MKFSIDKLQSATGAIVNRTLHCIPSQHSAGHCIFGPGFVSPLKAHMTVTFDLLIYNDADSEVPLVTLDVYNQSTKKIVTIRDYSGADLPQNEFELSFLAEVGQAYEFRVYWHGISVLEFSGVLLRTKHNVFDDSCRPVLPVVLGKYRRSSASIYNVRGDPSEFHYHTSDRDGFLKKGIRQRAYFDHGAILVRKHYPDTYLHLERFGVTAPMLQFAKFLQLNLYAKCITGFPERLFLDPLINWHQQQLGLLGLLGAAGLYFPNKSQVVIGVMQSDMMQRYLVVPSNRPYKTNLENKYKYWYQLLMNAILAYANQNGVETVYCPTSITALKRIDRPVHPQIYRRIYDYPVRKYTVRQIRVDENSYWEIDTNRNRSRIALLTPGIRTTPPQKVICLLHDIEGNVDTPISMEQCRSQLIKMLGVEKQYGIAGTYNILGRMLQDVQKIILDSDCHAIGFHSFNHIREELDQLARVRAISWKPHGYRPPGSEITAELSSYNLAFHNFEWLASSAYSFGFSGPRLENGIAKLPITRDDYDLHTGNLRARDWVDLVVREASEQDYYAFSVHDCYAEEWLDLYPELLERLLPLGKFQTCDQLAATMFLNTSRFKNPFDDD